MKSKKIYGVIGLGRFGMPLAQRLVFSLLQQLWDRSSPGQLWEVDFCPDLRGTVGIFVRRHILLQCK